MCRKSIISLLLVFTVATVFSLNSFAAPQSPTKVADDSVKVASANDPMPQSYPTGMLTGTGTLLVNGNAVQSGATVVSGSIVATDVNSDAVLDLGVLGRINLRPSTEIRIVLSANRSEVELRRCGSMTQSVPTGVTTRVTVSTSQMMTVASNVGEATVRGQLAGKTAKIEDTVILQGESKSFDKIEEITASGEATFTINCGDQDRAGGAYVYSPYGFLVLLGLAAGVALGIHIGDNNTARPQVTPVQT
jgi:hypothetical protein